MNRSSTDAPNMEHKTRKGFFKQQFPSLRKLLKYIVTHSSRSIEHDKIRRDSLNQDFCYLGELLKKAVTHPSQFIEHDQLAAFNISLTDFSLESDDAATQFFKPFPRDLMEESFKHSSQLEHDLGWPPHDPKNRDYFAEPLEVEGVLDGYHRYVFEKWEASPSQRSMWQGRCPLEPRECKYPEHLWETRKGLNGDFEEWRVNTVFYTVADSKPHLACPLIDGAIPDDRIRRAELLCILRLMKSAMTQAWDRKPMVWHTIYPVTIYSFARRKARILHAYFDGQTLHIRQSNYLDFMKKNMDNIKLYLRWMISKPIGDTMLKVPTDKDTSPIQKHDPHTSNPTAVTSPVVKFGA